VRQVPDVPDVPDAPPPGAARERVGVAGGRLPAGATVFDDTYPAVAELDPALLRALRSAATDARDDGVEVRLTSGWRSPDYQEQLLDQAISTYGSRAEAARWVATPDTSPHVSGDAVDVRGSRATTWLAEHGAGYGLCRVFANEPWHFELRPEAVERGCPARYADPTHDPRMQR
jgi:LAS superfamily LD-carboxypeptidase LdcB